MRTSEGRNIQELTQALRELQLAQDRVNAVIERIRQEESNLRNNQDTATEQQQVITTLPIAQIVEDRESIPGTTLRIGDRVKITNARRDQQDTGTITGYRKSSTYTWIIITPRAGQPIRRIAKNLRRL